VQDERAQAGQDSNAHLAQQIQGLVAQCAALAKAPAGTGRKQQAPNPAPSPAPAGQGKKAAKRALKAAAKAATPQQATPVGQQPGRSKGGAQTATLDPVLGPSVQYLKNPDAVRQALASSSFATIKEAQTDFSKNDTTTKVNGKGGCFWTKSAIGQAETAGCPYGTKCSFVH